MKNIFLPTTETQGFVALLTELSSSLLCMPRLTTRAQLDDITPINVPVSPMAGLEHGHCWYNSKIVVERLGGSVVFGWAFYGEEGGRLVAQHHAVWKTPNGHLVDVTPNPGFSETLFAPDDRVPFDYVEFRCPYNLEWTQNEGFMWYAPAGSDVERCGWFAICRIDKAKGTETMQAVMNRYLEASNF